jgi:abhydrolase domain-containing protein 1/3
MITAIWEELGFLLEEYPLLGLAFFFLTGLIVYYQLVVVRPVILHCQPSSQLNAFLRSNVSMINEQYKPTFWCFESRIQTIFASFVRATIPDIRYRREVSIVMHIL